MPVSGRLTETRSPQLSPEAGSRQGGPTSEAFKLALGGIGRVGGRHKREGIWGYIYTYS